jgi:hypothetical protein
LFVYEIFVILSYELNKAALFPNVFLYKTKLILYKSGNFINWSYRDGYSNSVHRVSYLLVNIKNAFSAKRFLDKLKYFGWFNYLLGFMKAKTNNSF